MSLYQQRPRPHYSKLTEQQDCRDQIVDHKRRLVDREEGPNLCDSNFRKRGRDEKEYGGQRYDRQSGRRPEL
jgi:hypothetical protein